ncbi:MAG: hypothetical protein U1F67_01750 [Rubrivivax sp.]
MASCWPERCRGFGRLPELQAFHREQIVPGRPGAEAFAREFQQGTLARPIAPALLDHSSPKA